MLRPGLPATERDGRVAALFGGEKENRGTPSGLCSHGRYRTLVRLEVAAPAGKRSEGLCCKGELCYRMTVAAEAAATERYQAASFPHKCLREERMRRYVYVDTASFL